MAFNDSISEATRLLDELQQQCDHFQAIKNSSGGLTWEQAIAEQQATGGPLIVLGTALTAALVEAYRDLMKTQDALIAVRDRVDAIERRLG